MNKPGRVAVLRDVRSPWVAAFEGSAAEVLDAAAAAGYVKERTVHDGAWRNAAAEAPPPGFQRIWRPAPGGATCQGCGRVMPDNGGIRLFCSKACKKGRR